MAKQRDYRAEYEARKQRAIDKGFEGYRSARIAKSIGITDPEAFRERAASMRERAENMRRQIHDIGPNRTLLTTTSRGAGWGVIKGRLYGAGQGTVHVVLKNGETRTVYGRGRALDKLRRELGGLDDVADAVNMIPAYGAAPIEADDIASVQIEIDQ